MAETLAILAYEKDEEALGRGDIRVQEFRDNINARGAGTIVGLSLVVPGPEDIVAAGALSIGGRLGGALGRLVSKVAGKSDEIPDLGRAKVGSSGGPGAGKRFSEPTKDTARMETDNRCVFCGKQTERARGPLESQIDHAQPRSRQGNNTLENAQNTCRTCNLKKGSKTTLEFLKRH